MDHNGRSSTCRWIKIPVIYLLLLHVIFFLQGAICLFGVYCLKNDSYKSLCFGVEGWSLFIRITILVIPTISLYYWKYQNKKPLTKIHSFSIIDVLAVIMVSQILFTILWPNFVEYDYRGPERAKALSEMRNIADALNKYYNDNHSYPVSSREISGLYSLTSPVSYISRVPGDRFIGGNFTPYKYFLIQSQEHPFLLVAAGHDGIYDIHDDLFNIITSEQLLIESILSLKYDPTNGAKSSGDIIFLGDKP